MNEKKLGTLLMFSSIVIALTSSVIKMAVLDIVFWPFALVWLVCGVMIATGFLLYRSNELEEHIKESQLMINKEFLKAKEKERAKDEFVKFLDGFKKDEIEVIEFLHTFEGISVKQLEDKVSFSKVKLDKILKNLEKDEVISVMGEKCYLKVLS